MKLKSFLIASLILSLSLVFAFGCTKKETKSTTTTTIPTEPLPKPDPTDKPEAPKEVTPKAGDKTIEVSWKESEGADSYMIFWGLNKRAEKDYDNKSEEIKKDVTKYTITGLENDKDYFIAVKAKNAKGESDYSDEVSAVPKAATPQPPVVPPKPTPPKPTPPIVQPPPIAQESFNMQELIAAFDELFKSSKETVPKNYDLIEEKMKSLTLPSFKAMSKDDKVALFINLYNAAVVNQLAENQASSIHESLSNKNLKSDSQKYEAFFKDSLFTKEALAFHDISGLSLNDMIQGIVIGNEDYLKNTKNKEILKNYHDAIGFENTGVPNPEVLFLFSCGSPVLPTFNQITGALGHNGAITGSEIAEIEASGKLKTLIQKFLTDDYGFEFRTDKSGWFDLWGSIENMPSVRLPYILKIYESALQAHYKGDTYFENFLLEYLPDSDEKTYLSNNISANKKCIQVDFATDTDLLKIQ
jgi:hypothetical protein